MNATEDRCNKQNVFEDILALILQASFQKEEIEHKCCGIKCKFCAEIKIRLYHNRYFMFKLLKYIVALKSNNQTISKRNIPINKRLYTPITLKVKMLN